jgi:hypothetical protein
MQVRNLALLALLCCTLVGCDSGKQHVVKYSGKVMFQDKPLTNGSVMFQPEEGIHARGNIGPDGSFTLTTYVEGDGATVGKNKVRVVSTLGGNADPTQGETSTGSSVIPETYADFSTTPLEVEVPPEGKTDAVLVVE